LRNPVYMRVFTLFLIVSLLFSLAACAQNAEATWQEQYDLGVRYLNEGKYEEAVIAFNAAIEIDPKQADAYIGLAEVYTVQGDTEKAAEVLEKAVAEIGETEALTAAMAGLDFSSAAAGENYIERHDNDDGSYYIYEYSSDGRMISYTYYDTSGWYCTGFFGEDGRNLYDIFYNADGSFDKRRDFEYDEHGNVIWEYNTDENGNLLYSTQYEYDEYGNRIRTIIYDADGNIQSIDEMASHYGDLVGGKVAAEIVGGTLDIGDLQVMFVPGDDEYNPGAVGRAEYSYTVYGPENLHVVLIGMWTQGSFDRSSLYDEVSMMAETWRDMDISDWGYRGLPAEDWTSRPVDSFEINEVCETILIGLDKNGDVVGYSVIRQQISASGNDGDVDLGDAGFVPTEPANLPSFDEINYFGQHPEGLTVMQMEEIAAQNGYITTNNQEWGAEDDYYWFQAESQDSWGVHINGMQYDYENQWSYLGYTHYYDYTEYAPINIGLRDIYTHDSMAEVLVKLGIPDAEAMAQEIEDISANYTFDEALDQIYSRDFTRYDTDRGIFFQIGNGGGSGPADENGVYYLESLSAELQYSYDWGGYSIQFEFTNGILTGASLNRYEAYGMG